MKKRMTILALLLAGAVTLGSYGMVQAGQEKREVPVAGVTQTLAQVLKEAGGVQAQTADVVEELQSNAAVPLRYNYDKPEKPRRIKGFEVFSLVFSSFSKPKNHTEISRIIGGVSLTTNE